jgi:hypothetical protein
METTQPRYEWRAWSERLGAVADRIRAASECLERRTSAEVYVVARTPGTNPKVRADRLDIKVLREVTDGFQLWDVDMKTPFPVPADVLTYRVLPILRVDPMPLRRDAYGLELFFDEIVKPHPDLADVDVKKNREFYSVDGCLAEIAEVTIAGRPVQTAAIESVDIEALRGALLRIGLDRYENLSYPGMLRRALGWGSG